MEPTGATPTSATTTPRGPAPSRIALVGYDDNFNKNKFRSLPAGKSTSSAGTAGAPGGGRRLLLDLLLRRLHPGVRVLQRRRADHHCRGQYELIPSAGSTVGASEPRWLGRPTSSWPRERKKSVRSASTRPMSTPSRHLRLYQRAVRVADRRNVRYDKTVTKTHPGYYTVPPHDTRLHRQGQRFSVVIKYTNTPRTTGPSPAEEYWSGYSSAATNAVGQASTARPGRAEQELDFP